MKKIERLNNVYSQEQLLNYGMISRKVNELVNAHNELLDTHTVKEGECFTKDCDNIPLFCEPCSTYKKEKPTTPEKSMTLPDGKEVSTSYSEIFDQDGKSIEGITAIQTFNGAIIVATANKMYCNKPEIFKTSSSFEEVATPEKREDSPRPQGEDWKEGIKPQKASYEVTCGRCEKSFKHSCGPEK